MHSQQRLDHPFSDTKQNFGDYSSLIKLHKKRFRLRDETKRKNVWKIYKKKTSHAWVALIGPSFLRDGSKSRKTSSSFKLPSKMLPTRPIWKDLTGKNRSKTISQLAKMGNKGIGGNDETIIFGNWDIITKNWSTSANLWIKSCLFSYERKNANVLEKKALPKRTETGIICVCVNICNIISRNWSKPWKNLSYPSYEFEKN